MVCRSRRSSRIIDEFPLSDCDPLRNTQDSSHEDYLPFRLDDDSSGTDGSPSHPSRRSTVKSTYGFSLDTKVDRRVTASNTSSNMNRTSRYGSITHKVEKTGFRVEGHRQDGFLKEPIKSIDQRSSNMRSKGT